MEGKVTEILEKRRKKQEEEEDASSQFYGIQRSEGIEEHFLELRCKDGSRICFAYCDLSWFNYDPEAKCIDLCFNECVVVIEGWGLEPRLFEAIKQKRLAWVREAEDDFDAGEDLATCIKAISVALPDEGEGE